MQGESNDNTLQVFKVWAHQEKSGRVLRWYKGFKVSKYRTEIEEIVVCVFFLQSRTNSHVELM